MTPNIQAQIKKIIIKLKKNPKVMAIIIFGSYAKRKTKPLSDIDIAVIAKNPDRNTEAEIASASSNLFDVVNFHKVPAYIKFDILKTGKPAFIRNQKFFTQTKIETLRTYLDTKPLYDKMQEAIMA